MTRAVLLAPALALAGCMVVDETPIPLPDGGVIVVAVDGGGTGSGTGGGGTGGGGTGGGGTDGGAVPRGFPGSGQNGDPGTGVLVLVRIDRGTANIATPMANAVQSVLAAVSSAGLSLSYAVAAPLYPQGMPSSVWARRKDAQTGSLADALRNAAASAVTGSPRCTTDAILDTAANIHGLDAFANFWPEPSAFLVAVVDTGPRVDGPDCRTAVDFAGSQQATWIGFWPPLPRPQVKLLFVGTSETETADAMRARCTAIPGFPTVALDVISPSPLLFNPLTSQIDGYAPAMADRFDACAALAGNMSTVTTAVQQWAGVLKTLKP